MGCWARTTEKERGNYLMVMFAGCRKMERGLGDVGGSLRKEKREIRLRLFLKSN